METKIIHSFWPKPFTEGVLYGLNDTQARSKALEKTIEFYKIGAKIFKSMGYEVVLYTDKVGKGLIGSQAKYDEIKTDLEILNEKSSPLLWGAAKVLALYKAHKEENNKKVIHVDHDVFFENPKFIKEKIESDWDVLVQSKEISKHYEVFYQKSIDTFCDLFLIPPAKQVLLKNYNYTYNCGFLGFKNIEHTLLFKDQFFSLHNHLLKNQQALDVYINLKKFYAPYRHHEGVKCNINCILEQVQITEFTNTHNLHVKEIIPISSWDRGNNQSLCNVSEKLSYEHLTGLLKYTDDKLYNSIINKYNFLYD